ncbi:HAD-IA family hydrolase [Bacillus spongiae]|uniref:HAD-IA family hydrolase n=1 Tax=Bacillus spongiae TaxID=2683610 RepID=A0ABU8HCG4_9BACI
MNILWDFDGTLFDTYPAYTKIVSTVLGGKVDEKEVYQKLKISFSHAIEYYKLSDKQMKEIAKLESELSPGDIQPFEKVEEILQLATKNVIMTHKDREGVMSILQYYGWDNYFEEIVTSDDGFPRKPHPQAYKYLHQRHQLDLVIGDRELDILPGKELGLATCLFQHPNEIATYNISDYAEFVEVMNTRKSTFGS